MIKIVKNNNDDTLKIIIYRFLSTSSNANKMHA